MPCTKFISIRLEPGRPTRIYVDRLDEQHPHASLPNLKKFTLRTKTGVGTETARGTTVRVEPLRWPPPPYDAPITMSLNAQWPFGLDRYESSDTAGHHEGRSFPEIEFDYDAVGNKLSWGQQTLGGRVKGSVEFYATSPVWNIVLELDPNAPGARGGLWVDGVDIS